MRLIDFLVLSKDYGNNMDWNFSIDEEDARYTIRFFAL